MGKTKHGEIFTNFPTIRDYGNGILDLKKSHSHHCFSRYCKRVLFQALVGLKKTTFVSKVSVNYLFKRFKFSGDERS